MTHRVQRVTGFRSAAMSFTQFITAMLLASVGMLLQGCGEESCDTDAINTCLTSYTESVVANLTDYPTICSAVNTYGSCLNSANCCPDSTAKNAIDACFRAVQLFLHRWQCGDKPMCVNLKSWDFWPAIWPFEAPFIKKPNLKGWRVGQTPCTSPNWVHAAGVKSFASWLLP